MPTMSDVKAIYRLAPGRVVVTVELSTAANNGLFLRIERTNPTDPVRNVRVIMPEFADTYFYDTHKFHPYFIHELKQYATVRFMDWQHANGQQPEAWADRATPTWRSVAQDRPDGSNPGVPIEDMVLVANMVGANPWFSMPYNADDDHIEQFAKLVKDTLRPDVDVYVEVGRCCCLLFVVCSLLFVVCSLLVPVQNLTVAASPAPNRSTPTSRGTRGSLVANTRSSGAWSSVLTKKATLGTAAPPTKLAFASSATAHGRFLTFGSQCGVRMPAGSRSCCSRSLGGRK